MTDETTYSRHRYLEGVMAGGDEPDPLELFAEALDRPDWHRRAACRGVGPDWWFSGPPDAARAVCAGCPVRVECVTAAVDNGEKFGVWGGTTPDPRRQVKRSA